MVIFTADKFRKMPKQVKHQIGAQYTRAMIDAASVNVEQRTVEVVFATDTPVRMYSWEDGRVEEVLSFEDGHVRWERINAGAPLLDNHQRYGSIDDTQIGVVEKAWKDGNSGRALVRFSKKPKADSIFQDVQDKIVRNISVGYSVFTYQKTEREGKLPEYRAIDWEPNEISFVPIPADPNAGVRAEGEGKAQDVFIIHQNKSRQMTLEQMRAEAVRLRAIASPSEDEARQLRELEPRLAEAERAANSAPTPAPTPAPAPSNEGERALQAERARTTGIIAAVRTAKLPAAFGEQLIANGTSLDKARELIIAEWGKGDEGKPASGNRAATVGADATDKLRAVMTDALILRGDTTAAKEMKPEQVSAAREFRGLTLLDVAKDCLERAGESVRGLSKMEIAQRAITSSTSDFPVLLEGTNRRILLANYASIPDTWRSFCSVGTVGDFREYKRIRMGSFSRLDKVPENAEYKNKKIPDGAAEKVSAETYGNTINVSRQMIVNDDLGAFTRLASMLGRAAARSIELDVYALLASNPTMGDGKTLFHDDHGNMLSSGAAPSVAQFEAMRLAMAVQKEPGANDYLDLRPSIWLGPIGLGGAARVVNQSQYDVDVSNKFQVPNKVVGLFGQIVDTARLTGTAYYALCNPADEPVLEVSFLDGVQTPFMESEQTFNVDGLQWKIRLDYGVHAVGWRGIIKNPGA